MLRLADLVQGIYYHLPAGRWPGHGCDSGRMSRPAARLPPWNGYRGDVARNSPNRDGATAARTAQAAHAAPVGTAQARTAQERTAQKGTAQLTAPAATHADSATPQDKKTPAYPGQQLGLPERGPGSVASLPRRV